MYGWLLRIARGLRMRGCLGHALCGNNTSSIDPSNALAHFNLGNVLRDVHQDWAGAMSHYRKTIELDPSDAGAYNSLGQALHFVHNDFSSAERLYRKAIELDPSSKQGHTNLGIVLKDREDYEGAEESLQKGMELGDDFACWHLSKLLENQKNDIPGAIKAIEEYIRLGDPDNDGEEELERLRAKL